MMDPDRSIWDGLLAHLRDHRPGLSRPWFRTLDPLGLAGGMLLVRTTSPFQRDYLQRQCAGAFNDSLQAITGRLLSVRFLSPGEAVNGSNGHAPEYSNELLVDPDYCFENFVIGPSNLLAHAASVAVSETPGEAYNPLFIHGGIGLGKTHLLQAICLRAAELKPSIRIHYTACEYFTTQFREALQSGRMSGFRHKFRDVDVLLVDDIHHLASWGQTQEEFFHTFNALFQARKQIVLSSDAPPGEIPDLEERLVSRFKSGLVAHVSTPCFETRVEILRKKAQLRGIPIPDEVFASIAKVKDRDMREMDGALRGLEHAALTNGVPITVELAGEILGVQHRPVVVQIGVILEAVTDYYGVRATDLKSKRKTQSIVLPRQICMYLAREMTRHSYQDIGLHLGGRDHTTVMHARKIVLERMERDPDFKTEITTIRQRILERSP